MRVILLAAIVSVSAFGADLAEFSTAPLEWSTAPPEYAPVIQDGSIICNGDECFAIKFIRGWIDIKPIDDARFLAAVRIYRYKFTTPTTAEMATASCTDANSAAVGDLCDPFEAGLDFFSNGSER